MWNVAVDMSKVEVRMSMEARRYMHTVQDALLAVGSRPGLSMDEQRMCVTGSVYGVSIGDTVQRIMGER